MHTDDKLDLLGDDEPREMVYELLGAHIAPHTTDNTTTNVTLPTTATIHATTAYLPLQLISVPKLCHQHYHQCSHYPLLID
jgi:hypothetical protein